MLLSSKPSMITQSLALTNPKINPMSISTTTTTIKSMINDRSSQRRPRLSALEARVSLVFALAAQTSALSQRLLMDLATETAKYVNPKRFESRNLEEALMAVPDLETVEFKVLSRRDQYEIREVELEDEEKWQMSFVMPSKYGSNLPLPKDPSVKIKEVPKKIVAVAAFSGFVTDEEVTRRESILRDALKNDPQFQVKEDALVEVAQYNPPFTLPFTRRNEIVLEVERKSE
ncbi:hypothetical protein CsSME_00037999 [Camellia sinensis var. sinensis]